VSGRPIEDELQELADRTLTPEELAAWADAPLSEEERRGILELVDWFVRRYPDPLDRLRSSRRAYEQASRRRGIALRQR
jgi:hypothetical protein